MKNITLLNNDNNKINKTTGFAPVIGYEPWALRTIESCKQSLKDGQPILIRLHSAASYPCESNEDTISLDMESHAVLIVGYDDEKQEFDIIDPWNSQKGAGGGIGKISYEILPIVCVNATAEKTTRISLVQKNVTKNTDKNGNNSLKIEFGFYIPKGYIIDEQQSKFTRFNVELSYEVDSRVYTYTKEINGSWYVGETAVMEVPVIKNIEESVVFNFKVSSILCGERPYKYSDNIDFEFNELMSFANNIEIVNKNILINIG